ncbi:hypothetical protein ACFL6S_28890 [Candidatus Poribacteria bacterium]
MKKPWHWADLDPPVSVPALSKGDPIKVRITERESQTDELLTPLLDVFCLTTDAAYIPVDADVPELAPKAVEPGGKLSTTWAWLKESR